MTLNDVDEVANLFAESFTSREPLGKHLHLQPSDLLPFGQSASLVCAQHGLSLVSCVSQQQSGMIH